MASFQSLSPDHVFQTALRVLEKNKESVAALIESAKSRAASSDIGEGVVAIEIDAQLGSEFRPVGINALRIVHYNTGPQVEPPFERHDNSRQLTLQIGGSGHIDLFDDGRNLDKSHTLDETHRRSDIPVNQWHRPVALGTDGLSLLVLHTAASPNKEIINYPTK